MDSSNKDLLAFDFDHISLRSSSSSVLEGEGNLIQKKSERSKRTHENRGHIRNTRLLFPWAEKNLLSSAVSVPYFFLHEKKMFHNARAVVAESRVPFLFGLKSIFHIVYYSSSSVCLVVLLLCRRRISTVFFFSRQKKNGPAQKRTYENEYHQWNGLLREREERRICNQNIMLRTGAVTQIDSIVLL